MQKTDPVRQALNSFVVPVVITTFNIIMPFLFASVAPIEQFKTKRGEIRMTLLRAILVRVTSLVVLIITDYTLIKCTQEGGAGGANECTLQSALHIPGVGGYNDTMNQDCNVEVCVCSCLMNWHLYELYVSMQCWETFIEQDFYRLALTNCAISITSTLVFETVFKWVYHCNHWSHPHYHHHHHDTLITSLSPWHPHHFIITMPPSSPIPFSCYRMAHKLIYPKLRWNLFTKGTFNIPKSILDLIYTQLLLWYRSLTTLYDPFQNSSHPCRLGFLFSRLQPVVIILTIFITFYVKKVLA